MYLFKTFFIFISFQKKDEIKICLMYFTIINICTNIKMIHSWHGYDDSSQYPHIVRYTTKYSTFSYIAIAFDNEITINRSNFFPKLKI